MLDAADFGVNPHAREFGQFGSCQIRYGKAKKGSPPKRRGVLTVWDWTAEVLEEWFTEIRPLFRRRRQPGSLAVRARAADRLPAPELPIRCLPGRAGPGHRARFAWAT
jgi:hypothetical protein